MALPPKKLLDLRRISFLQKGPLVSAGLNRASRLRRIARVVGGDSRLTFWLLCVAGLMACDQQEPHTSVSTARRQVATSNHVLAPTASRFRDAGQAQAGPSLSSAPPLDSCMRRILELERGAAEPGAPQFEARRSELLGRAKASPISFVRAPRQAASSERRVRHFRQLLSETPTKALTLYENYLKLRRDPALARAVLLSEGYLFTSHPSLAFALTYVVRLEDLFVEPVIWLERGSVRHELERVRTATGHRYVFTAGAQRGKRAGLWFLDRVARRQDELALPLHRDWQPVQRQLGFERGFVRHVSEQQVSVDLTYGRVRVPTLLRAEGAKLGLDCEALTEMRQRQVTQERNKTLRRMDLVDALRGVIERQIAEGLPFDEPRTEEGQQDGKLRDYWFEAYHRGHGSYEFNGDRYSVFDRNGRPHVPQVCIDFITDTIERVTGRWWNPRGQPPGRSPGLFTFNNVLEGNRRRVPDFVAFARAHPKWFEVAEFDPGERVPLRRRKAFFRYLSHREHLFYPGDIVIIYGLRDDGLPHYHSFFIYERDPLTAMPTLLASNAVKPQVRSWEGEMHNAPLRTIRTRIRPRVEWLGALVKREETEH